MKKILFILCLATNLLLIATNLVFATTMTIPFRCWESELVKEFKKEGINLDKTDPYSDGFIENCGAYYKIHTYSTPKDINLFIEIPRRVYIKMEGK